MSSMTSELHSLQSARIRWFVWPREHGAWGILLVPLVTGAWVGFTSGDRIGSVLLLAVASLALFCLRTPVEALLETSPFRAQTPAERLVAWYSIAVYVALASVTLGALLWRERAYSLLLLGGAVALAFVAQAVLKKLRRQSRMAAQLIGALGLTSTAAAAYYVVRGELDARACVLWAVNWLFAANQIHFVQLRIHAARAASRMEKLARGRAFLAGEIMTTALLALAWRFQVLPGVATLAFGPVLVRGVAWFLRRPAPLAIFRLGFSELAHALTFGALLIVGFQIHGE